MSKWLGKAITVATGGAVIVLAMMTWAGVRSGLTPDRAVLIIAMWFALGLNTYFARRNGWF